MKEKYPKMYSYPDYLMHHGVKGMKWGVRRARNKPVSNRRVERKEYKRVAKNMRDVHKRADLITVNTNTGYIGAMNSKTGAKDVLYIGKEDAKRAEKWIKRYNTRVAVSTLAGSGAAIAGLTYLTAKGFIR